MKRYNIYRVIAAPLNFRPQALATVNRTYARMVLS